MQPGAGDADIQQPALLLYLLIGLGVGDRHHAFGETDQEDGVPLQALGGVQGRERHPFDRRGVLGVGPLVQLGDEVGEGGRGPGLGEVLGEPHQSRQRLPAVSDRPRAGRRPARPAHVAEHRPHLGRQVHGVVEQRVVGAEAGRATQLDAGLAHLGPLEEPLGAPQLIRHADVGERLLVDLGLGVDTEEHGDLAGGHTGGDQVTDPAGGALGLGGLVGVLRVHGLGPGLALRDQLQPLLGRAPLGLGEEAVGEVHDLGVER